MKWILYILSIILMTTCEGQKTNFSSSMKQPADSNANRLINESSPYLLQHAYNPVDWRPWNEESLLAAQKQDKPLLISIGYSACHWCHVMERESFEDEEVAQLMNENFICIKVDREERPDIDHLYMDAVQLMSGKGGWPLNCFAMPDGRPFYGGTYFPKEQWKSVLKQLANLYNNEHEKVIEYADKLSNGLKQQSLVETVSIPNQFEAQILRAPVEKWLSNIDPKDGGNNYAPKFPMPNNYEFLLHYLQYYPNLQLEEHLQLTLRKMAYGGIYDQIGGGFSRYSTDMEWKVPHFEKMLYDNAQLISLYAQAYKTYQDPLYKKVVEQSIGFLQRELRDPSGAFYSALDADSEGEEGKFYVWQEEEIHSVLDDREFEICKAYYNLNKKGRWEGKYILLRDGSDEEVADKLDMEVSKLRRKMQLIDEKLLKSREKRVRPGLDDKSLTSWNALCIIGLMEAYEALGEEDYLKLAKKSAQFIVEKQMRNDGGLFHAYKNGKSTINGFLEDYSFSIEAFIYLYENTFDAQWLNQAESLAEYLIEHFYDEQSAYFYFNSDQDPALVSRKIEKNDNVIPASNSSLCKALFKLGSLLYKEDYLNKSDQLLANSEYMIKEYLPYASNWGIQYLIRSHPFYETAILGEDALQLNKKMQTEYLPHSVFLGSQNAENELELLKGKWIDGENRIYVCVNKSCMRPVSEVDQALKQMRFQ